jgi:hypothetical protein
VLLLLLVVVLKLQALKVCLRRCKVVATVHVELVLCNIPVSPALLSPFPPVITRAPSALYVVECWESTAVRQLAMTTANHSGVPEALCLLAYAGSAGVSSGSLRALLSDKQVRHDLLVAAFQAGGVLQQLSAQQSRRVFEHAEVLAAVAAVLEWQRQQEAAAGDAQSGGTFTGWLITC